MLFSIYRGISKDAKYLIYASILPAVAYGMFYTDISYFLTTVQGFSYEFMGLIITVMGISTFAACIPLGKAADKYGRKKMLILGNFLAGIIIVVFALTTNPFILIAAAVFEGISEAAFSASSGALLADKADTKLRNSAFSLFGFAQSIAFGVGSILIPGVAIFELIGFNNKVSHSLLYATVAALALLSTLLLLKVSESDRDQESKPQNSTLQNEAAKVKNVLWKYVFTSAIIAFGAGMVVPLMTAWLKLQYGVSDAISGPILGVTSIVIGVATLTSPFIAKKVGLVKAIVLTQATSTVFMFATPLLPDYLSASSVYTLRAFLMNMASPLSQSMIMGLVPRDQRGVASGINAALWRLPNALSTFAGAYMMAAGFLALPFFVASILYMVSIILFWRFFKTIKMPEEIEK